MHIVVHHAISNPQKFWSTAKDSMPRIPPGIHLHSVYPSADGTKGVCLWEAESVEMLKAFIEPSVKDVARNEYFAVDAANAFGMPAGK